MKTAIFCTTYFKNQTFKENRLFSPYQSIKNHFSRRRVVRWLRYYSKRLDLFGAEQLFLIDDGSDINDINVSINIIDADCLPDELPKGVILFRFNKHLGRSSLSEFPGWWRSFSFSYVLIKKYGFHKIIHIESDAYITRMIMADYIRDLKSGWTCFFCPMYGFPETAIQVICEDSINDLKKIWDDGAVFWSKKMLAEQTLPFDNINKSFNGDRYSEELSNFFGISIDKIDYVCQAHPLITLEDRLRPKNISNINWYYTRFISYFSRFAIKSVYNITNKGTLK